MLKPTFRWKFRSEGGYGESHYISTCLLAISEISIRGPTRKSPFRCSRLTPATAIAFCHICGGSIVMSLFEACHGPSLAPQDNIFARYVRGEGREEIRVVADTDEFLAFWDAHPAAKVHLLIVPKKDAVRNPNCLRVDHVELLERMVNLGRELLKQHAGLTFNQQHKMHHMEFSVLSMYSPVRMGTFVPRYGYRLIEIRYGDHGKQTAQASLGFHMPPWTLVPHLHMHAIAPLKELNWWQRLHFLAGSFWYKSAESILARLKSQQTTQLIL